MRTLFLLLLFASLEAAGQITCYDDPLNIPPTGQAPPQPSNLGNNLVNQRLANRKKALFFHESLMQIQEPSTLSFFGTDYTINRSGYQKKMYILQGNIQTPIAIGGKRFTGKKGKWMSAVHVNPEIKIIIFNDDESFPAGPYGDQSLPVRTPSTIPGITYYGALTRLWDSEETIDTTFSPFHNLYFGIRAFHHSNGQDGSEMDTLRVENAGKVNIYNGNFGEQVAFEIIIGGVARTSSIGTKGERSNQRKLNKYNYENGKQLALKVNREKEWYWRLSYEFHPQSLTNKKFDSLSVYGRYRLNFTLGRRFIPTFMEVIGNGSQWCQVMNEQSFERWRYTINVNYILDGDLNTGKETDLKRVNFLDATKRLNLWGSLYWIMPQTRSSALFAQIGYFGSSNYNIYFMQSQWNFRFGLAFGVFNSSVEKDKI